MADFSDLERFLERLGQQVGQNADRMVRRVALAVDAAVVLATPVDTGRARANWQVQVNSPVTSTRAPYAAGSSGSAGAANAQAAIEQGKAAVAAYRGGVIDARIHITNNLPYIGRLNEGSSAQAPAAFVQHAVAVGVQAVLSSRLLGGGQGP